MGRKRVARPCDDLPEERRCWVCRSVSARSKRPCLSPIPDGDEAPMQTCRPEPEIIPSTLPPEQQPVIQSTRSGRSVSAPAVFEHEHEINLRLKATGSRHTAAKTKDARIAELEEEIKKLRDSVHEWAERLRAAMHEEETLRKKLEQAQQSALKQSQQQRQATFMAGWLKPTQRSTTTTGREDVPTATPQMIRMWLFPSLQAEPHGARRWAIIMSRSAWHDMAACTPADSQAWRMCLRVRRTT